MHLQLPQRLRRVGWVLLAAVPLLASAGCRRESGPVRIGLAGPLTDPVGAPMRRAAELAVAEINAQGGVNGRPIQLVERNDFADPDSAVFVATDLYNAGVAAVIGHVWSATTMAAAPVYNGGDHPVVAISPSSSAPGVSDAGPYIFRLCPSDYAHAAALARWVRTNLGFERGVILYSNDDYGRGLRQTFVRELTRLKGEAVEIDPYLGEKPEVGPYLERIAASNSAQFIMAAGGLPDGEHILREARKRKITIPIVGADGLEGIEALGALAEGVYVSGAYLATLPTPANTRFVAAYRKRYPDAGLPNQPAAAAYDAVYLLRDAIARVGTDREAIRRAIAGVGTATPPYVGVTGRIAFDSLGDVPNAAVHIAVIRNGTVLHAEGQ